MPTPKARDETSAAIQSVKQGLGSISTQLGAQKGSGLVLPILPGILIGMARPLRLEFPGAIYHLTARGDRREDI